MKEYMGIKYLKMGEVSKLLKRGPQMIKIWYLYKKEHDNNILLPPYFTNLDARGSRFWKETDIPKLIKFRNSIEKGMLSETTVYKWGKRGENIIKNGTSYRKKRIEKEKRIKK